MMSSAPDGWCGFSIGSIRFEEEAETGRRQRSRLARILDVAQGYACGADGACGLAGRTCLNLL
jgi:hypothetical protein